MEDEQGLGRGVDGLSWGVVQEIRRDGLIAVHWRCIHSVRPGLVVDQAGAHRGEERLRVCRAGELEDGLAEEDSLYQGRLIRRGERFGGGRGAEVREESSVLVDNDYCISKPAVRRGDSVRLGERV